jgi:hypothetical protein
VQPKQWPAVSFFFTHSEGPLMTIEPTIPPVYQVYHHWRTRRRELRVIPAVGDDMTPIAVYPIAWDDKDNVARDEAIARPKQELGAR